MKSHSSPPVPLSSVLTRAIERTAEFACSRQVRINQPSLDLGFVRGEEDLLVRALQALLETAVKFSEEDQAVQIGDEVLSDSITLIIDSYGRTIPQESISRFFDVFAIGEAITTGGDLGLGPPLASRILSLFGGKLTVANRESSGIRLAGSFQLQNGA